MAIHDVGKDNTSRDNPQPNSHDTTSETLDRTTNFSHSNSSASVLRVVNTDTATIDATNAVAGTPIIVKVEHDLGYIPVPLAYEVSSGVAYVQLPFASGLSFNAGQVTFNLWFWVAVDNQFVYFNLYPGSSGNWGVWDIRYYLLQQQASQ